MNFYFKQEKGITLLEILAVLVIIALVFIALSRNFGFGTDKARVTDVQQTFKPYQIAFEGAMNEYSGIPVTTGTTANYQSLNRYLGGDYQLADTSNGGTNPPKDTKILDPWNRPYQVQARVTSKESYLILRSKGRDGKSTDTDLFKHTQATTDADDLVFMTQYKNGLVKSCSNGFERNLGGGMDISGAGVGLPAVSYDVSSGLRDSFLSTYAYEYGIETTIEGIKVRTFIYSHTPLNLTSSTTSSPHGSIVRYFTIQDSGNKPFVGFDVWMNQYDSEYQEEWVDIDSTPEAFYTPRTSLMLMRDISYYYGTLFSYDRASIDRMFETGGASTQPNTILNCK